MKSVSASGGLPLTPVQVGAVVLLASEGLGSLKHIDLDDLPVSDGATIAASEMFWIQVKLRADHCNDHPSKQEIIDGISRYGVPDWMGAYVAERLSRNAGHRPSESFMVRREKLMRAYGLALEIAEEHERGGTQLTAVEVVAARHHMAPSSLDKLIRVQRAIWMKKVADGPSSWPTRSNLPYIRAMRPAG